MTSCGPCAIHPPFFLSGCCCRSRRFSPLDTSVFPSFFFPVLEIVPLLTSSEPVVGGPTVSLETAASSCMLLVFPFPVRSLLPIPAPLKENSFFASEDWENDSGRFQLSMCQKRYGPLRPRIFPKWHPFPSIRLFPFPPCARRVPNRLALPLFFSHKVSSCPLGAILFFGIVS